MLLLQHQFKLLVVDLFWVVWGLPLLKVWLLGLVVLWHTGLLMVLWVLAQSNMKQLIPRLLNQPLPLLVSEMHVEFTQRPSEIA